MTKKNKLTITEPFINWAKKSKRIKIAYGGRGGGKSESIANILVGISFIKHGTILCTRDTQTSITTSVYPMLLDIIKKASLEKYFYATKNQIVNKITNSNFIFTGLKDFSVSNIKSVYNVIICWIEEAENITEKSWVVLEPSIRGYMSEIWVSFNPKKETDIFYKIVSKYTCNMKENIFTYKNKEYKYLEYEDENILILNLNFYSNNFLSRVIEKSRLMSLKLQPELYSHIWLGELKKEQGKIFIKDKLKFYNEEEYKTIFPHYIKRAIVDPAFGEKSCFTSAIIYTNIGSHIYLNDSGLLRANSNQTTDEIIEAFLIKNSIKEIMCEANFSQSELIKKLRRRFDVRPFYVRQNKIERIVNSSILVYEKIFFPDTWLNSPESGNSVNDYIQTKEGRGFVALQQLLNFSDIEKENCRVGDDYSYLDFPDALSSLVMYGAKNYDKTIKQTSSTNYKFEY